MLISHENDYSHIYIYISLQYLKFQTVVGDSIFKVILCSVGTSLEYPSVFLPYGALFVSKQYCYQ